MKTKHFALLAKQLLPDLPGFAVRGSMLFIAPVNHVLRGFYFESSSFDARAFYFWMFFLPLCVPEKHVSFYLGRRIWSTCGERWNAEVPSLLPELIVGLKAEALPLLSRVETLKDLAQYAGSQDKFQDPYTKQAIAYALAYSGEIVQAINALNQLLAMLDTNVLWQHEMSERAITLKREIGEDPLTAKRRLEAWESETIVNLGLDDFI